MESAPFDRRRAWFILLQFLSLPIIGWWLGNTFGPAWLCNLLTPFWMFVVFPLLDTWIGLDTRNPSPGNEAGLTADTGYQLLPLAALPAYSAMLLWAGPQFANSLATPTWRWRGTGGWRCGLASG